MASSKAASVRSVAALFAMLSACQLQSAEGSSLFLAEKCRGGTCTDPKFPILDFDKEKGECICRAHPCWNNNGVTHSCSASSGFPFLHFTYGPDRSLTCSCSSVPQYDSVHVSKDMCPGETCESAEFPVLDYDKSSHKCMCRAHPCWNQDGHKHMCKDPKFPVLHYREDVSADGHALPKCECVSVFENPTRALRGAKHQKDWGVCTFSQHHKSHMPRQSPARY